MKSLLINVWRAIVFLVVISLVVLGLFRSMAHWREQASATDLSPANGQFVEAVSGNMHVSVWGPPDGKAIVFTHGMAAWGGLWSETAEKLAARGYRVYAVDQPPFGFSDRVEQNFSREAVAANVNQAVAALKLSDAILVGHSFGGGVALEAAMTRPDLYQKLVLVCPVTGAFDEGPKSERAIPFFMRSNFIVEMLVSATITNPLMTGFLTKRFMHRKANLSARHVEILQRPMTLSGNTEAMAVWLQQFVQGPGFAQSANSGKIAGLKMPIALIWGDKDKIVKLDEGQKLAALFGNVPISVLHDVGHMPQLEDNAAFTDMLLAALN